ncbi:hypothetical protein J437_LFUL008790 [Ladona fulva]|uniref:G-protein coupled receptors family 1 profile domain-containing protein n=1 Tax=Ladona fulva TaxID=123851 RepID=A0A8K0P1Q5_LADFU|nr:hypothetical protein J437_LFUL008790 [Ladona fulva]
MEENVDYDMSNETGSDQNYSVECPPEPFENYTSTIFGTTLAVPEWEAILTALALSLLILLTLIGNVLVILSVFTYKPLRIVQNFFIVSLAVADMTVAVLVLPFNVAYSLKGRWMFGISACKMWLTCDVLCCTASILHLCAIALDRYWAITDPIAYAQKRTFRRVMLMIGAVWLVSGAISSPPLAGWNDWPEAFLEDTPCELTKNRGYVIYSSLGSFYIPLFVMTIVYAEIYVATRKRLRERAKASKLNAVKQSVVAPAPAASQQQPCKAAEPVRRERSSDSLRAVNDGESVSSETNHNDVEVQPLSTAGSSGNGKKKKKRGSKNGKGGGGKTGKKWRKSAAEMMGRDNSLTDACEENGVKNADGHSGQASDDKKPATGSSPSAPLVKRVPAPVHQFIEERQRISLSKERRAARTLGVIMGVFVVCWLPFFLMYIILPFCERCCLSIKVINFITWLGYINSALNPIIYTIFNLDFRRAFKKLLHMKP